MILPIVLLDATRMSYNSSRSSGIFVPAQSYELGLVM